MIRLLVGLGNPGPEYEATRHNAGFWWIDEVAHRWSINLRPERSYHGLAARHTLRGEVVWLLEPQTYMNLSGKSVAALARFFKIDPTEILVVHDELDLLPGQAKLKQGGNATNHNGLKDIQAQLGSPNFWRLRLGIGHPGDRAEVVGYVLRKPPESERLLTQQGIDRSLEALDALVSGDMAEATRLIHAKPERPKPPRKPAEPGRNTQSQEPTTTQPVGRAGDQSVDARGT